MLEMKRCVKLMTAWRGWMEREVQREADSFGESGALRHVSAPPRAPAPSPLRSIRAAIAPSSALKSYWLRQSQLLGTGQERERDAVKQKLLQDSFLSQFVSTTPGKGRHSVRKTVSRACCPAAARDASAAREESEPEQGEAPVL